MGFPMTPPNTFFSKARVSGIEYILWLAVTGTLALPAQTPPDAGSRQGAVSGTVTDASSGARLRKAYVRLQTSSGKGAIYSDVTDNDGKFSFPDIPAGSYRLTAERQGFLDGAYGGRDGGVELKLSAGETLTDLEIQLRPQAVLTGRVVDEDGDPWTHARVVIYRSAWRKGKRELESFNEQDCDDQGNFRIAQLPAGRYYIAAQPEPWWESRNGPATGPRHVLTWYPGAADAETALALTAGEQTDGIEIRLRRSTLFRIRGKVTGLKQIPPAEEKTPFSSTQVSATRVASSGVTSSYNGSLRADDTFEIAALPAGDYQIRVWRGYLMVATLGRASVRVDGQDLDNVTIALAAPHAVKGSVRVEGGGPFDPKGVSIRLEALEGGGFVLPTSPRDDGSFEFAQVSAERYRVLVTGSGSRQTYLKLVRYGDSESHDGTFSAAASQELTVVLSTRGARLTGKVTGTRKGRTTPQVVLIPDSDDTAPHESEARIAVFDQYEAFAMGSIAPGPYHLYAFESVPDGAWEDSDLMREIAGKGMALRFEEGDAQTVEAALITASEVAPVLARLGIE